MMSGTCGIDVSHQWSIGLSDLGFYLIQANDVIAIRLVSGL